MKIGGTWIACSADREAGMGWQRTQGVRGVGGGSSGRRNEETKKISGFNPE